MHLRIRIVLQIFTVQFELSIEKRYSICLDDKGFFSIETRVTLAVEIENSLKKNIGKFTNNVVKIVKYLRVIVICYY